MRPLPPSRFILCLLTLWTFLGALLPTRAQDIYTSVAPNSNGSDTYVEIPNPSGTFMHFYSNPTPSAARMRRADMQEDWPTTLFGPDPGQSLNRMASSQSLRVYPKTLAAGSQILIEFSYGPAGTRYNIRVLVMAGARVDNIFLLDPITSTASTVRWRVNFDQPINNVTAENFALNGGISGVSIASITPDTPQPSANWTVTANTGTTTGLLNLRWVGTRTETPPVPNSFVAPFSYSFPDQILYTQNLPTSPVVVLPNTTATLSAIATRRSGQELFYRWYVIPPGSTTPTAIPGATGKNFTAPVTSSSYTPPAYASGTYQYFCSTFGSPDQEFTNFLHSNRASVAVLRLNAAAQAGFINTTGTPPYNLATATEVSVPGGSFTGNGVSGDLFNPAVAGTGVHTITYSVGGQQVSFTVTVNEQPSLTVNTTADVVNNKDNLTSLREAVAYAQSLGGPRTVNFAPALAGQTVTLTEGWADGNDASALQITGNLTLQGHSTAPGVTLRIGTGIPRRHFFVHAAGTLTLENLTLTNGYSVDFGGAVWNFGTLTVRNCTFAGNFATSEGGAIQAWGHSPALLLENSTFLGNTSNGGGSALNLGSVSMTLRHLTITGNAGTAVPVSFWTYQATALNCLIAGNSVEGVASSNGGTFHPSSAGNILGTGSTAGLTNSVNGNTTGLGSSLLRVGGLADNGGPTQTVAPLVASPLINAGSASPLPADQRGQARVGAPDVGAVENSTGNGDADGDTLSNLAEALLTIDPTLRDTDGDGFNDPTEILSATSPLLSSSKPGTTHFARVLGTGPVDGLDLIGNFRYAVNIGTNGASGAVSDAAFTSDSAPGITVTAPFEVSSWAVRDFGSSAAENVLEGVVQSIRWGFPGQPVIVQLADTVPGRQYKMQVLMAEGGDYNRRFDVLINGTLVADDINPSSLQGIPISSYSAGAVVHEFTATSSTVTLSLDGANVTTPSADNNPILSGVTLEEIPTPALAPVLPPTGTHTGSFVVNLTTPSQGAAIRYTTDGSLPTATNGTLYTAPFTLYTSTTVRAISVSGGWLPSPAATATYTIQSGVESWRTLHGLAADGSQDLGNPSADGVANIVKYAFNLAPAAGNLLNSTLDTLPPGGTAGLPRITSDSNGQITISFIRRKAATNPGISYLVQTTRNLSTWTTLDLASATIGSIDPQWERVTVIDPIPGAPRFARVHVETLTPYSNTFASGPGNATLLGSTAWSNGEIVLTEAAIGQGGSIILGDPLTNSAQHGFTARFHLNLGPAGQISPGDGVSFAVGGLGGGAWGESGPATSQNLTVGFDTYNNGSSSTNIGIHLWVNGTHFAVNPTNPFTNGSAVPVEISHDLTNGITVKFNHAIIFAQVPTPGFTYPENGRFGFGARTGGAVERAVIDNVVITPR